MTGAAFCGTADELGRTLQQAADDAVVDVVAGTGTVSGVRAAVDGSLTAHQSRVLTASKNPGPGTTTGRSPSP